MTAAHHAEVFFVGGTTGWAFASYDDEGNQIGEAAYEYRQRDAIAGARRDFPDLLIHIFNSTGTPRRIEQPKEKTA
jgi:hypothetical protein